MGRATRRVCPPLTLTEPGYHASCAGLANRLMAPATLRGTADEVTRRPAGNSAAVVSSLTVCPPAGTSSRTVIEYDTGGRRLPRRTPATGAAMGRRPAGC